MAQLSRPHTVLIEDGSSVLSTNIRLLTMPVTPTSEHPMSSPAFLGTCIHMHTGKETQTYIINNKSNV